MNKEEMSREIEEMCMTRKKKNYDTYMLRHERDSHLVWRISTLIEKSTRIECENYGNHRTWSTHFSFKIWISTKISRCYFGRSSTRTHCVRWDSRQFFIASLVSRFKTTTIYVNMFSYLLNVFDTSWPWYVVTVIMFAQLCLHLSHQPNIIILLILHII